MTTKVINVSLKSLESVISNALTVCTDAHENPSPAYIAAAIMQHYTDLTEIPQKPKSKSRPVAFMIKDKETDEFVQIYSPFNSREKCTEVKERYFASSRFEVVRLEESDYEQV